MRILQSMVVSIERAFETSLQNHLRRDLVHIAARISQHAKKRACLHPVTKNFTQPPKDTQKDLLDFLSPDAQDLSSTLTDFVHAGAISKVRRMQYGFNTENEAEQTALPEIDTSRAGISLSKIGSSTGNAITLSGNMLY